MGELKDQADEYLADRAQAKGLRFRSAFAYGETSSQIYAVGEDGRLYEAAWSIGVSEPQIEGWRRVNMTRFEEEYVDSE